MFSNVIPLNENLIFCSGMIPGFVNYIMKVDTPKKLMIDVTVILSWVDDNGVKNYIHEASVFRIISNFRTYELN